MPQLQKTHEEYLLMAYRAALKSPDPSTQNGAIIVFHDLHGRERYHYACNTYPEGVKDQPERLVRPLKYAFIEHAERNVIFDAARDGTFGCYRAADMVMYAPWFACADCARAIIQVGIKKVIGHQVIHDKTPGHWKESINHAYAMFKEAGVETQLIPGELNGPELRFNGELWRP
jgi:dCMP deaminase